MSFDVNALGGMFGGLMAKIQQAADVAQLEGTAGGGMVKVTVNGKQEILSVSISDGVMDDREMLEDLICVATNDALRRSKEFMAEQMKQMTGGLPIPPGLF